MRIYIYGLVLILDRIFTVAEVALPDPNPNDDEEVEEGAYNYTVGVTVDLGPEGLVDDKRNILTKKAFLAVATVRTTLNIVNRKHDDEYTCMFKEWIVVWYLFA